MSIIFLIVATLIALLVTNWIFYRAIKEIVSKITDVFMEEIAMRRELLEYEKKKEAEAAAEAGNLADDPNDYGELTEEQIAEYLKSKDKQDGEEKSEE